MIQGIPTNLETQIRSEYADQLALQKKKTQNGPSFYILSHNMYIPRHARRLIFLQHWQETGDD